MKTYPKINSFKTQRVLNHRGDQVEIGDTKQPDVFYPQAKFTYWNNECNFSLRLDEDITDATNENVNDKIVWRTKDQKKECHLYELKDTKLDVKQFEDGGFEIEVLLHEKPKTNIITYTIRTKGLRFSYQPELTQDEIKRGCKRPENVIGSYAVFHESKMHNFSNVQYKSGKAFHIYRPLAVDSNDSTAWCALNIDEENELLTIEVPQDFIDNSVYPIKIDPTIGYTSIGGSTDGGSDHGCASRGAPSGDSPSYNVSKITAYGETFFGTTGIKACIWEDDGASPYPVITNGVGGTGTLTTSAAWHDLTYSTQPSITEGQTYLVGVVVQGFAGDIYYDTDSGNGGYDTNNNYSSPDAFDIYFGDEDQKFSVYATYTEPGAGYSHTVNGVAGENIANVNGVESANIANVNGVE